MVLVRLFLGLTLYNQNLLHLLQSHWLSPFKVKNDKPVTCPGCNGDSWWHSFPRRMGGLGCLQSSGGRCIRCSLRLESEIRGHGNSNIERRKFLAIRAERARPGWQDMAEDSSTELWFEQCPIPNPYQAIGSNLTFSISLACLSTVLTEPFAHFSCFDSSS